LLQRALLLVGRALGKVEFDALQERRLARAVEPEEEEPELLLLAVPRQEPVHQRKHPASRATSSLAFSL